MFKKFLALALCFVVTSVHASALSQNNLKTAFDDLSYSLSVEWDQKDKAFYNAEMKKFQDQVATLQANGMSNQELVEFTKSQLKDEKMAKDLEVAFNMISLNKLSASDARKLVLDTVGKSYSRGASWNGAGTVIVAAAVVLILVVALAASSGGNVNVNTNTYQPYCYDQYNCYDYYDSWGYYWYTDCFYQTYCY
jgi:hypothetical protein